MIRILIVDDDIGLRKSTRLALESKGWEVVEAQDGLSAIAKLQEGELFDLALIDINMPHLGGLETLEKLKEICPSIMAIMITAYSDVKDAVQAMRLGAFDYIQKPMDHDYLLSLIESAFEANAMVQAVARSAPELLFDKDRKIIGNSNCIQKVFDIIYKLSKVDTAVLIRGESGTGKELVARALHYNSHRRKGPFVAVNCAAIPENLIESELFGYEKGAFTGADKKKPGKFAFADGGTIFLDEIGDISLSMQAKLLRVLQERSVMPVGGNIETKIDARIIAATNRPLERMIAEGKFREDLFYRLNILPINLPPLRDRREDITSLVDFMISKFNIRHGRKMNGCSREAIAKLLIYSWPGNIRELENVIEHAFIIESSNVITPDALPTHIANAKLEGGMEEFTNKIDSQELFSGSILNYPELKDKFEKEFIIRALKAFGGRINQTAEHTKMTKVTLLRKLSKFNINPKDYHQPRN